MRKLKMILASVAMLMALNGAASAEQTDCGVPGCLQTQVEAECPGGSNCVVVAGASECPGSNCHEGAEPTGDRGRISAFNPCPTSGCEWCPGVGCGAVRISASLRCPVQPCGSTSTAMVSTKPEECATGNCMGDARAQACPHNCAAPSRASGCVGPGCIAATEPNGGRGRTSGVEICPNGGCDFCGTSGCRS